MKKTNENYKTPFIRVVKISVIRQVCKNSIPELYLSPDSDMRADYGEVFGDNNDL